MARGSATPAAAPLPEVKFEKVRDELMHVTTVDHEQQMKTYGFNDSSDFKRPDQYIRHIEPLESELAVQVEYDMDEQDQEWLSAVNADRKSSQADAVSYEIFEIIMDRLEKEWFDLTKNIPKPEYAMPSEDSTCSICDDSEGENSNAIVFCDGCNLAVHQDCYGVPYIPEGQWLCRKCTVSPEVPVSCIFCPNEGGAFKQTVSGDWAHLLCAIWIPETRVANDTFMEPITDVERISKQRWKLRCSICNVRSGACIQCCKATCVLAFHATCARKEKLLLPMKSAHGEEAPPTSLQCYCEKHLPPEYSEIRLQALSAEQSDDSASSPLHRQKTLSASKSARAHAKSYNVGAPLVPAIVVKRILNYTSKLGFRKKEQFILLLCKFWSLKREARRGAPLLKRLHLEPWTSGKSSEMEIDNEARQGHLEHLQRLKEDLLRVKEMADLTRKRENVKFWQSEAIHQVFSSCFFPNASALRRIFDRITTLDKDDRFKSPVSRLIAPDYYTIVQNPMCWDMMEQKLDRQEYWDVQAFKDDVNLVLNNALLYNKPATPFHKTATRMRTAVLPILADLDNMALSPELLYGLPALESVAPAASGVEADTMKVDVEAVDPPVQSGPQGPIGDLEPSLTRLEALQISFLDDDVPFVLDGPDILETLFSFALPQPKSSEPTISIESPSSPSSQSLPTSTAAQQRPPPKKSATQAELDSLPGFRAPKSTRSTSAGDAAPPSFASGDEVVETPTTPRKTSRRGASVHIEEPPLMEDVSSQNSFQAFSSGWIFPPGHKRVRKPTSEPSSTPPPPNKKLKIDTSKKASKLSTITPASANRTLQGDEELAQAGGSGAVRVNPPEDSTQPAPEPNDSSFDVTPALPESTPKHAQRRDASGRFEKSTSSKPGKNSVVDSSSLRSPSQKAVEDSSELSDISDGEVDEPTSAPPSEEISQVPDEHAMDVEPPPRTPTPTLGAESPIPPEAPESMSLEEEAAPLVLTQAPSSVAATDGEASLEPPGEATPSIPSQALSSVAATDGEVSLDLPAARTDGVKSAAGNEEDADADADEDADAEGEEEEAEEDSIAAAEHLLSVASPLEPEVASEATQTPAPEQPALRATAAAAAKKKQPGKKRKGAKRGAKAKPGTVTDFQDPGPPLAKSLVQGTLVWAQAGKFPYWPAAIECFKRPLNPIPASVSSKYEEASKTTKEKLYLFQFFEDKNSWEFAPRHRLRMLGENEALDRHYLQNQRFNKGASQRKCKMAYDLACSQIANDGDPDTEREEETDEMDVE